MNVRDVLTPANSPLVDYALKGLDRCWLSESGRWSHIYHLDGRREPNESVPPSDVFYTLNVLLGMTRVPSVPAHVNPREIFLRNARQLKALPVSKYAFGVALWTSAELGVTLPDEILRHIEGLVADRNQWRSFRAQDLGMIIAGVVAQAKTDRKWTPKAAELVQFLLDRYYSPSGLFFDAAQGPRRRFASFATQTYLLLACYTYGELTNDSRLIEIANATTRKLIGLQGPAGEWPWFFDATSGRVLDFYEVYSVHQYGMAPAFLEMAEQHGVQEARDAICKGFRWVLGQNQLSKSMLVPDLHLSIRSQVRRGELKSKGPRVMRSIGSALLQRDASLIDPSEIELRLECRSYELGWILWSFGSRSDLPELTHHAAFTLANQT
ncbi:hypothetical protein [Bradyrhizobium symbiodeficiens]|uniref:hypothetical protein n=1 Tax=Bradyrhizobium symbiodeficiens TaxID=1404367 RepID=UPI00140F7AAC|nr:hypothetical protein [Bradyrhizobium symbiodeficiens]QIO98917.1 hypothetical protein HAU86_03505 [Bradyrhizobium symbiodeficiens]